MSTEMLRFHYALHYAMNLSHARFMVFWATSLLFCTFINGPNVALFQLLSLPFIISQGLQRRLNPTVVDLMTTWADVGVQACMSVWINARSLWLLICGRQRWAQMSWWNPLQGSSPHFPPGRLLLAVPLLASLHAGHNRNSLAPPSSLHPPCTFPNSIFLLITMLFEHQMLPNNSHNCVSGTLDDIKGPF